MRYIMLLLLSLSFFYLETAHKSISSDKLFADKLNADLYWKALRFLAHNDKDTALKIAAAIKTNQPVAIADPAPTDFDRCLDNIFITTVARTPERLTFLRLFESIGIREHNAYLNDFSAEARLQKCAATKALLAQLHTFATAPLDAKQRLSYKIMASTLTLKAQGEPFIFHKYFVNQMFGMLFRHAQIFTELHPLEVKEDVHTYVARLGKLATQVHQAIDFLKLQTNKGIVPPQFVLQKTADAIKKRLPPVIKDHTFYIHLSTKLHDIKELAAPDKEQILTEAAAIIEKQLYPAYQELQTYIEHLLKTNSSNHGVWALPDGKNYYNYLLQRHTTTNLTAEQIHQLGMQEVTTIETQMRALFAQLGMVDANKSIGQLMTTLSQDPAFYYADTEQGQQQYFADYADIIKRSREKLSPLFDLKPTAGLLFKPVPKSEENERPFAYYYEPSYDGSRPDGIVFINLAKTKEMPKYGMETLAVHEAEPGHHFQLALQQKMDMPMIRKISSGYYTAFVEGWGLYAEKLADEHNFYSSPSAKLGHLRDDMMRAVRLVVDTGIHDKRWTREQAIEYMQHYTGKPHEFIVKEIERYFIIPGHACAYKIGQLKMLELRQRAKDALGDAFDIRQFHNVILQGGAMPLTVLEQVVEQYITAILKR